MPLGQRCVARSAEQPTGTSLLPSPLPKGWDKGQHSLEIALGQGVVSGCFPVVGAELALPT